MFIVSLAGFDVHWPNLLPDQKRQEIGCCKQTVRALQNSAPRESPTHDLKLSSATTRTQSTTPCLRRTAFLSASSPPRGPFAYYSKHSPDLQLCERAPMHRPRQQAGRGRGRAEAGAARRMAARVGVAKAGTTRAAARMDAARLGEARSSPHLMAIPMGSPDYVIRPTNAALRCLVHHAIGLHHGLQRTGGTVQATLA